MGQSRFAPYAQLLQQREKQLRGEIAEELSRSGNEQYAELAGSVNDSGDASVATLIADLGNAMVTRQIAELREIEAARLRMADGSYATCQECGGDIGAPRLRAYPTATRCIACQTQREKTYAQDHKPTL